jgi:hypothetical protein
MRSGSGVDLFKSFNEGEVNEVLRRCTNCGRFVLIGPPRSGKTFFRENYLEGRLGAGVTVDEHTLGIITTTKTEGKEARGGLGLREKVMRYLEGMIPLIRRLREKVRVEDEELRRILGDRAPKPIVEGARGMIGDSPHRAYYIPWDSDEVRKCMEEPSACAFGANVGKALKLIKETFGGRRIKWFKAEYIPPGLVEEVVDLIREKGEDGAREVLRGWVDAYSKASEALSKILGVREELFEWESLSVVFLNNFVNNYAKYVIGSLATALIGAASLAAIAVLTYMAFKKEGEGYLREIIELRESLEGLRRRDGEFSELGGLLVYRVAYVMGMSYDEAKKALMGIADLSIEELERRVNEIGKKIKELEKKFELFRQEEPAGIATADVGEFTKGGIYLNIEVEGGELRVCVEGQCYNMVRAGRFNELVSEIKDRLLKQGFAVVVGPKGIGKSTLAAAVIWELLVNGDVGRVARVDVLNEKNYPGFERFLRNYSREFINYFGRLLILYDPVSTETYEREPSTQQGQGALAKTGGGVRRVRYVKMPSDVEATITNLINASSELGDLRPPILIVLPSDIYNTLSEEMRNELEGYRLDVSQGLINTEFLAGLIREYTRTKGNPNGCALSDRELNELTGELAEFDSGHALIARLVGEELARNNCSAREIKELISKAKGKAEKFIILHINGLFKVHKNINTAKALVEIFALRRPFVNEVKPGDPILTPGIIELIGEKKGASLLQSAEGGELRGWLAIRQHDLIEEAIKKLFICIVNRSKECEKLGDALKPWKTIGVMESLRKVSEKVRNEDGAVKYFAGNYGEKLTSALKVFSNCWKRAALIIGFALAGRPIVPRPEDLPSYVVESLGDALKRCGVDDYLLVGNEIPPLIMNLTKDHAYALTEAFIDKYDETVAEVRRVLGIARGRGISVAEAFYGLGLASIIAKAVESGKPVGPSDADAALHIASFVIQRVASPDLIKSVLGALEPLRGKAPHRYLELLALASGIKNLDLITVRYIFDKLNEILDNYGDVVRGYAWSLVNAIIAYANLLGKYLVYFSYGEIENIVGRVIDLLNELDKLSPSLGDIAWAHALDPALNYEYVRGVMEKALRIDVVDKASEVLDELSRLRGLIQELMGDEEFMGYVESKYIKADEEAVKGVILDAASHLKHALAIYRLGNDELYEAARLFNEAAKESREIAYENYLINSGWVLRAEAIKDPLAGNKLINGFRQLYEEAFNKERFSMPTARYLSTAPGTLGNYLVSLALTGDHETISKLLEKHWRVLNADKQVSVLTRLMLNALLGHRVELSSELKGKLSVNPEELIDAFGSHMRSEFLPALMVAFGVKTPEDGIKSCEEFNNEVCVDSVLAVKGNSAAVKQLRELLINVFQRVLNVSLNLFKELGVDIDTVLSEFRGLVSGLDGKSLAQLIAPANSLAQLALMLYALVNGNKELAKALALMGAVNVGGKLPTRLYLEAYKACCDLKSEGFRRAVAKLFFLHV